MFDGEQLQQLIGSTTTRTPAATLPHLPFVSPPGHHHHHVPNSFPCFDPIQPHFIYPAALAHHRQSHQPRKVDHEPKQHHGGGLVGAAEQMDASPWPSEEVVALFRIRSSFPEFTWEHVSRKPELGYEKSADKCKEKFELESRCFDNNYRIFNELDELCHGDREDPPDDDEQQKHIPPALKPTEKPISDKAIIMDQDLEQEYSENNINAGTADDNKIESTRRKRMEEEEEKGEDRDENENEKMDKKKKKVGKLEMLKGLCEQMVSKLMARQEEMHNKLIQDMLRKEEEKAKREEAWKKQELERINKELEARAKEQQIAGDRQASLLNFLSKLAASIDPTGNYNLPTSSSSASSSLAVAQNPSTLITHTQQDQKIDNHDPNPTSSSTISPQVPNSPQTNTLITPRSKPHQNPITVDQKEDHGSKRWPRDEVLALINIRCSLSNSSTDQDQNNANKDKGARAPLWERISQAMLELGYKRSAKRCKEKWENINKYFRKTKDSKKRSVDSRTCPYFHQLSTLYNQGKLSVPENHSGQSPAADVHASEGEMVSILSYE